jgi:site-specific DNA-methyltransferase (adenine-specific)
LPTPYHHTDNVTLHLGDCLDILPTLPDASIDAIITDPPYGLTELTPATVAQALTAWLAGDRGHVPDGRGFMGKDWDRFVPPPAVWDECLRVLKPGGHLVAFAGSRTVDLMGLSIRLAGFELRDGLMWLQGQGYPKSLDVAKAIDKAAGAQRKVVGNKLDRPGHHLHGHSSGTGALGAGISSTTPESRLRAAQITAPATPDAVGWQGWGTALKPAHEPIVWAQKPFSPAHASAQGPQGPGSQEPAHEPIVLARKPLAGTVAANVLEHGTGALNVDGCRVAKEGGTRGATAGPQQDVYGSGLNGATPGKPVPGLGRWPTNVVLSHPPLVDDQGMPVGDACASGCVEGCPVAELDAQSGATRSRAGGRTTKALGVMNDDAWQARDLPRTGHDDHGGASRFFPVFRYQAKAPSKERPRLADGTAHSTVKPLALMRWLVLLVTPPGGLVLDPFAGSGTTLEAAVREGFEVVGMEQHEPYAELCRMRLSKPAEALLFDDVT